MLKALIPIALLAGTAAATTPQGEHHGRGTGYISRSEVAARSDDARIAKRLAGLVPGKPQDCITPSRSQSASRFGDQQVIQDRFGKLYATRFQNGCRVTDGDALVSFRPGERLCRGEIAEIRDMVAGVSRGACVYGEFVPYSRPR